MTAAVPKSDVHSVLSPSDAGRWLPCGEAIRLDLERQIPDTSGSDADLGTAAHSVFEWCLKRDFASPHQMLGEQVKVKGHFFEVDREMADAVEVAVDFCRDLYGKLKKGKHHSEVRVLIPFLAHPADTEPAGGTIDWHAYDDETLHVLDYKNGMGLVEAEDNEQGLLYVWGVLLKLNRKKPFKNIYIHIAQPRASHPEGPCRTWMVSYSYLQAFKAKVEAQVKAIKSQTSSFGPTEKGCKWCDHKAVCPGLTEKSITEARQSFAAYLKGAKPTPACSPKGLSSEQLAEAMSWVKLIAMWAEAVPAEVFKRTEAGDKEMLKHYKIVTGKSNRQWKDEAAVQDAFTKAGVSIDKFAPRKLVGIGDGEMLIKIKEREAFMSAVTIKPQGKPTLAHISDPRPAVTTAAQDFAEHLNPATNKE